MLQGQAYSIPKSCSHSCSGDLKKGPRNIFAKYHVCSCLGQTSKIYFMKGKIVVQIQTRDYLLARQDRTRLDTGCLVSRKTNGYWDSETKNSIFLALFREKRTFFCHWINCFITKTNFVSTNYLFHLLLFHHMISEQILVENLTVCWEKLVEKYWKIYFNGSVSLPRLVRHRQFCLVSRETKNSQRKVISNSNPFKNSQFILPWPSFSSLWPLWK